MKISELQINTIIRVSNKMKVGTTIFSVLITTIEIRADEKSEYAYVGYIPCSESDSVKCGFGYMRIYDVPRQWGIQTVDFVRESKPVQLQSYPNLVGNPGYDLIHDPSYQWRTYGKNHSNSIWNKLFLIIFI